MQQLLCIFAILLCNITIYAKTVTVTTNSDNGPNSLGQAITDINNESDSSNTINMQISDLPVIKKIPRLFLPDNKRLMAIGSIDYSPLLWLT